MDFTLQFLFVTLPSLFSLSQTALSQMDSFSVLSQFFISPSLSSLTHKSQGDNPLISTHLTPLPTHRPTPTAIIRTTNLIMPLCTNPSSLISCTALDLTTILSFWWLPDLASAGLRFSDYVLCFLGFRSEFVEVSLTPINFQIMFFVSLFFGDLMNLFSLWSVIFPQKA